MNRRTYIRVLLWLLPLVIARALIPSGFMLGTGADGFGLIFCSGNVPAAPHQHHLDHAGHVDHGSAHAGHNHYEADNAAGAPASTDHSGHSHDDDNAACPFAIGACAASIDIPYLAAAPAQPVDESTVVAAVLPSGIDTPRVHPIRGPPHSI